MISIIVPVYKVEKYIRRCVDSILSQTYQNTEVLLIDDGSPDSSGDICDEYAEKDIRVRVFHKENGGVSSARNLGLKEAKGDYIGFVDADDYISPNMYDTLIRVIEKEKSDIAICGYQKENDNGSFEPYHKEKINCLFSKEEMISNLLTNKFYSCSACIMLFNNETIKGLAFDERRKHNEDLLYIYEAMKRAESAAYTAEPYYYYCTNEGSASLSAFSDQTMDIVYISEYILQDIKNYMPQLYSLERREFMRNNITCAKLAVNSGYDNSVNLKHIQRNIRRNILWYLFSSAALGYKYNALLVSINWRLFSKLSR